MLDKNIIETYLYEYLKSNCEVAPACTNEKRNSAPIATQTNAEYKKCTAQTLPIVELHECINSTNTRCKEIVSSYIGTSANNSNLATENPAVSETASVSCAAAISDVTQGCNDATSCPAEVLRNRLVIAKEQSAGKGRQGRAFFSPKNTGIYFSLLVFSSKHLDAGTLMAKSAMSVCSVCEKYCFEGEKLLEIKWPNDVYYQDKKIAGILIEAGQIPIQQSDSTGNQNQNHNQSTPYYIIGIGINVFEPQNGWPDKLNRSTALLNTEKQKQMPNLCNKLIANIAGNLFLTCNAKYLNNEDISANKKNNNTNTNSTKKQLISAYNERFMLKDKEIEVLRGNEQFSCKALGVDDDFCLCIRKEDGTQCLLSSGEVHLKL